MAFTMYGPEVIVRTYPATFRDADGAIVTDVTLEAAMLPAMAKPNGSTQAVAVTYSEFAEPDEDGHPGGITVLLSGPEVADPPGGAFLVPYDGGDFFIRHGDSPEVDWEHIERINIHV